MNILNTITQDGCYVHPDAMTDELRDLLDSGLIVCVRDIPHHPDTLNPDYSYVPNDDDGRNRALDHPLFTLTFRR